MGRLEGERHRVRRDLGEPGASARAIDETGVKGFADAAPQDIEHMPDATVGAGDRAADFAGFEQDEVQALR